MRITLTAGAVLFFCNCVFCQQIDFQNYTGLYSAGTIPADFTKLSSQKYQEEKENISTNTSRRDQKAQDQFYLESNFLTDDLLHSGRIIFGDPVTNYLNQIKAEILKGQPKIMDEIRIYTFRSNIANAYTFNNGIVLVSTGLLAQVENEAQIAFILCHEFEHYIEKHALNSYVESKKRERGEGIYQNLDPQDVELEGYRYSKELEEEADAKGMTLYKTTKYSADAVEPVFDVLLYSYLPYDEIEFDKTYFNHGSFRIPKDFLLDTVQAISAEEDYDDAETTHPNIKKRKEKALKELGTTENTNRKEYLVSEETFHYVQKLCRYEAVKLYLNELSYEYAFYTNYLLMKDDPENPVLKKNYAKALYGLSVYKTGRSYGSDMHVSYKKVEGSVQQVYYMAEKIPAKDFSILALEEIWPLYKENPQDKTYERMCDELMYDVLKVHRVKVKDFKTEYLAGAADTVTVDKPASETVTAKETEKTKTTTKTSKYKKTVEKKETETKTGDNAYWKFAFVDLLKDKTFADKMNEREKDRSLEEEEGKRAYNKKKDEYALGINKLMIVDPIYLKVDETSETPVNYIASEEAQFAVKESIDECAELLDLKVDFLSNTTLENSEVQEFNAVSVLNDWLSEKLAHEDAEIEILNSTQEEFKALIQTYNVEDFAWLGILSVKEKEQNIGLKIASCLLLYPIPFVIYDFIEPNNYSYFFTLVANADTGTIDMGYFNGTNTKDRISVQKSNIYYILQQIKSRR